VIAKQHFRQKLYCAPSDAAEVLVVDTANGDAVSTIPGGADFGREPDKWIGIAGVGNNLYCVPKKAREILVIENNDALAAPRATAAGLEQALRESLTHAREARSAAEKVLDETDLAAEGKDEMPS
jgi:hypothetical protein